MARLWCSPADAAMTRWATKASTFLGTTGTRRRRGPTAQSIQRPRTRWRRRQRWPGCGSLQPTPRRRDARPRPRSSSAATGPARRRGPNGLGCHRPSSKRRHRRRGRGCGTLQPTRSLRAHRGVTGAELASSRAPRPRRARAARGWCPGRPACRCRTSTGAPCRR